MIKMEAVSGNFLEDGNFSITLRPIGAATGDDRIVYVVVHAAGRTEGSALIQPAADKNRRIVIEIDHKNAPIHAIELDPRIRPAPDLAQFLTMIFPRNDAEFDAILRRKVSRYGDRMTHYYVARQTARHFEGRHASRCVSAVVMGYKAAEIGRGDFCTHALAELASCLDGLPACNITASPRTNGEHLLASMLCVKWHVELVQQDWPAFIETLEATQQLSKGLSNYFTPAYPISGSMVMLAVILKLQGDHERVAGLANAGFEMFQLAVAGARKNLTHFQELSVAHGHVSNLLQLAASRDALPQKKINEMLQNALRLGAPLKKKQIPAIIGFARTE